MLIADDRGVPRWVRASILGNSSALLRGVAGVGSPSLAVVLTRGPKLP